MIVDCCDAVNCYLGILELTNLVNLLSRGVFAGREDYCHAAERTLPIRNRERGLNGLIAPWCGPFGQGAVLLVEFEQPRSPEYRLHGGQKFMHLKGLPEDQSAHTPNE